jgi:hypothetical protein
MKGKGIKERMNNEELQLLIEDIDKLEYCRPLSMEQKLALISFVYEISIALYYSYQHRSDAASSSYFRPTGD